MAPWILHYESRFAFTTLIFQQMPGYFFTKNRDSHFIGCNAAFAEFAGETMESLIGMHETQMPRAAGADHFIADERRMMETGEGLIHYREPKHGHTIITNKIPFRNAEGEIVGVIGNCIIIPDRDDAAT